MICHFSAEKMSSLKEKYYLCTKMEVPRPVKSPNNHIHGRTVTTHHRWAVPVLDKVFGDAYWCMGGSPLLYKYNVLFGCRGNQKLSPNEKESILHRDDDGCNGRSDNLFYRLWRW